MMALYVFTSKSVKAVNAFYHCDFTVIFFFFPIGDILVSTMRQENEKTWREDLKERTD